MELLKVEHLSKIYGKGENQVYALNDVSFSVCPEDYPDYPDCPELSVPPDSALHR